MARPSKYSPEFRVRAVSLVLETGRPIKHVADELGLGSEPLRQWVRQHEADQGLRADRPTTTERLNRSGGCVRRRPSSSGPMRS